MKFCIKICVILGFACFVNFVYENMLNCHPELDSGSSQNLALRDDVQCFCQELVRSYIILEDGLTRGVKAHKKEKKEEKDIVEARNITTLCEELGDTFLATNGCQKSLLPAHCQKEYDLRIKAFSAQLDRDIRINDRTVVSRSGVKKYEDQLLSSFKKKFIDPIVCACNFEPKLERRMRHICEENTLCLDGVYGPLAEIFEAKKQAIGRNMLAVFGRNKTLTDNKARIRASAGDVHTRRAHARKLVTMGCSNDFFTQKEFEIYLEQEMKEFITFAKNISVSLWWQELSKHIDLSGKPESKLDVKADKRHLLTPPACFKK